jgi:micrococcal nuclease
LGQKATARLEQLIASGVARIIESGRRDKYGRTLAVLTVNGEDVAGVMIGEGLARAYHGERRQSWCGG